MTQFKRGRNELTRQDMFEIALAEPTDSYTPISNQLIIETALEEFDKAGYTVRRENYATEISKAKFIGSFTLSGDTEMDMMFAFKNSYDKSMSAGVSTGAQVGVCLNGMLVGENVLIRKHTGDADKDIVTGIIEGIKKLHDDFEVIQGDMQFLKEVALGKKRMAEILGDIYCNTNIVKSRQLEIIRTELFEKESYDYGVTDSLYNLYQAITHALKTSHPTQYVSAHVAAHKYITEFIK